MNTSDPDHGDRNELLVKENGLQTSYAASFVVLCNGIPLFTPIKFNKEVNGIKKLNVHCVC